MQSKLPVPTTKSIVTFPDHLLMSRERNSMSFLVANYTQGYEIET